MTSNGSNAPATNNLIFGHVNIRSLLACSNTGTRLDKTHDFIKEKNVSILALTETHLASNIDDNELYIDGYQIMRKDRRRFGGGVAFYVRDDLPVKVLTNLFIDGIESLWLLVTLNEKTAVFGVCYRPPNQCLNDIDFFINGLYASFDMLFDTFKCPIVLMSDFNDSCETWLSDHKESELGLKLCNLLDSFNMYQIIDEPTRGKNLLDLLIVNNENNIIKFEVLDPFDNLDHCPIIGTLNINIKKYPCFKRIIRLYNENNLTLLNENFKNVPWHVLIDSKIDCDTLTNIYTKIVQDEISNCIPTKEVLIRPRDKPGMTTEVRRLFRCSHRLHKIAQRSRSNVDIEKHRDARRVAKKAWNQAKKNYLIKLHDKINKPDYFQKGHWALLKNVMGPKFMSIPTLIENEINYNSESEKCEVLNNFFVSLSNLNLNSAPNLPKLLIKSQTSLCDVSATVLEVRTILQSLNAAKSNGPDNIGNLILKRCSESLAEPITILINKSLHDGVFPCEWKHAHVTPVFKKGDRQIIKNYRPISLLSSTSKIVERIVYNKLYEHCMSNNLLSQKNSGFKKKDGAVNRLIYLVDKIYKGFDDDKEIAMIFLDIGSAFNRVWHDGLIHKLQNFGIGGKLLSWFKSYLSGRTQKVVIRGFSSSIKKLLAGVPQGSILGPWLFLIFINDIEDNIESDINLFADDTALVEKYSDGIIVESLLNKDLERIACWSKQWLVDFNPNKTVFVNFSLKKVKSSIKLSFNGVQVVQSKEQKHLGIIFSEDMKWTKHVSYITNRAHTKIGLLYKNSIYLSNNQMSYFYKSAIRPIVEYASVVFDCLSLYNSICLENVQRRAARVCTGAMKRTELNKMLNDLGWETLSQRRTNAKLILFYKIKNKLTPTYLSNIMPVAPLANEQLSKYNLRTVSIARPKTRLKCYELSYFPSTVLLWRKLPNDIVHSENVNLFKSRLLKSNQIIDNHNYHKSPFFFKICSGFYGKVLNQIRYGLSPLKFHLFTYNIIENPICPTCFNSVEDCKHYFIDCPGYDNCRKLFISNLTMLVALFKVKIDLADTACILSLIHSGFDSDYDTSQKLNETLFCEIKHYMISTKRFSELNVI